MCLANLLILKVKVLLFVFYPTILKS